MKIKELRDGMRRVDVEVVATEVSQPRTVNLRTGDTAEVADVRVDDDTGHIKLSLWGDQIEKVAKGTRLKIANGYTNSFRGELQLNIGKYGKLEILKA